MVRNCENIRKISKHYLKCLEKGKSNTNIIYDYETGYFNLVKYNVVCLD